MKFQRHWHVLTHLVLQHHLRKKNTFSFSDHIPLREKEIVHTHRNKILSELEVQVNQAQELLNNMSDTSSDKYKRISQHIHTLSTIIAEKKK